MCDCPEVCAPIKASGEKYISPTYHHGLAEGFYRSPVCECGYWECEGRGCADCPSCYGEHCECGLLEFLEEQERSEQESGYRKEVIG